MAANKDIDYRPALYSIRNAIEDLTDVHLKGILIMANDFGAALVALDAVEAGIREVAAAIANPATDLNDQPTIDALTARLTAAAEALAAAKVAEDAEDGATPDVPAE